MADMALTMHEVSITNVAFGPQTKVQDHTLYINQVELLAELADPMFQELTVDLARPGESVRIIPVKDVLEPRIKLSPKGGSFPGFLGRFEECGIGATKALKGCAVVTCGTILGFQEGIIDMSGPGAEYCY